MAKYRCAFSYYGGKSRVSHLYPAPRHDVVVEPFAGGAGYSLLHCERQVWLNDLDDRTRSMWEFMVGGQRSADDVETFVPDTVRAGQRVSEFVAPSCPEGLIMIMRADANQGSMGTAGLHDTVTKFGEISWVRLKRRLLHWIPRIGHWRITGLDWSACVAEGSATYFVDPPYSNPAGSRYRQTLPADAFARLGEWCRTRDGQVIACENAGATWLPFTVLCARRGVRSRYQKSEAQEVVWCS